MVLKILSVNLTKTNNFNTFVSIKALQIDQENVFSSIR